MKKALTLASILMALTLIVPIFAQEPTERTWAKVHGRVTNYGTEDAHGWMNTQAEIGNSAHACVGWVVGKPHWNQTTYPITFNFYTARITNTTVAELDYNSADLYIAGLWDVYNFTFVFYEDGTYSYTVAKIVNQGEGSLTINGGWAAFTLTVAGIAEVGGIVTRVWIRNAPIPWGDVSGPNPGDPDNAVNIFDLVHAARVYGESVQNTFRRELEFTYQFGIMDVNFDLQIDIIDLTTIAANLGEQY